MKKEKDYKIDENTLFPIREAVNKEEKEFKLSERRYRKYKSRANLFVYDEEDIKEFIRRLKEIKKERGLIEIEDIDKLAGSSLIESDLIELKGGKSEK